jgi:hypothetical protein
MVYRRTLTIGVAVAGGLAAFLAAGYWAFFAGSPRSTERLVEAPKQPPQLYCVFIRFTGEPRLEFLFDIDQTESKVRFELLHR